MTRWGRGRAYLGFAGFECCYAVWPLFRIVEPATPRSKLLRGIKYCLSFASYFPDLDFSNDRITWSRKACLAYFEISLQCDWWLGCTEQIQHCRHICLCFFLGCAGRCCLLRASARRARRVHARRRHAAFGISIVELDFWSRSRMTDECPERLVLLSYIAAHNVIGGLAALRVDLAFAMHGSLK